MFLSRTGCVSRRAKDPGGGHQLAPVQRTRSSDVSDHVFAWSDGGSSQPRSLKLVSAVPAGAYQPPVRYRAPRACAASLLPYGIRNGMSELDTAAPGRLLFERGRFAAFRAALGDFFAAEAPPEVGGIIAPASCRVS